MQFKLETQLAKAGTVRHYLIDMDRMVTLGRIRNWWASAMDLDAYYTLTKRLARSLSKDERTLQRKAMQSSSIESRIYERRLPQGGVPQMQEAVTRELQVYIFLSSAFEQFI